MKEAMMSTRLFVGNLNSKISENELSALFGATGNVISVLIPTDHQTGTRKNYGFVEVETSEEAKAAVEALDGHMLGSRAIKVTEIQPAVARNSMYGVDGFRPNRGGWGGNRKAATTTEASVSDNTGDAGE